jgi:hypothetical protein
VERGFLSDVAGKLNKHISFAAFFFLSPSLLRGRGVGEGAFCSLVCCSRTA